MPVETVASGIDAIAGLYTFREPDEVRVFLKRNPFLFEMLERTRPEIVRVFGEHAQNVFLETHYGVEEREESLWIRIQVDLNIDEAEELLGRFDREWWLKTRKPFFGTVEADIEFGSRVRS
jgi:hypothetical protein